MATVIKINEKDVSKLLDLAKRRHDAKPNSIRNSGILIKRSEDPLENYLPHFIGIIGEYAWGSLTNKPIDEIIYRIRDSEDFNGEEVKTITYFGAGEPELKIKIREFKEKTPKKYILARINKDNVLETLKTGKDSIEVELLGQISREDFDSKKKIKKYGANNPYNYIVGLSEMTSL